MTARGLPGQHRFGESDFKWKDLWECACTLTEWIDDIWRTGKQSLLEPRLLRRTRHGWGGEYQAMERDTLEDFNAVT